MLSFSREPRNPGQLAAEIGARATVAEPGEAVASEVVVLSVPWGVIDEALAQVGSLEGRIVVDTTNQFVAGVAESWPDGRTAAQHNAARMVGARYTKSFNTLRVTWLIVARGIAPATLRR